MDPTIKPGKQAGKRAALFIFPLVLATFLLLIHPGGIIVGVEKNSPPPVITIEEAKELALIRNRHLRMEEMEVRKTEMVVNYIDEELADLRSDQDDLEDRIDEARNVTPAAIDMGLLTALLRRSVELDIAIEHLEEQEESAKVAFELSVLSQEEQEEETLLVVGERYAGLLMLAEQVAAQEESLARLNENLRLLEEHFTVGFVTEIDVEQMRARVRAATAGLQALEHKKTQAHQALAMFMGLAADASFTTRHFTPSEPSSVDFDALLAQELMTGWPVRRAGVILASSIDNQERERREHGKNSLEHRLAELSVEKAVLGLGKAQDEVRITLLANYHHLLEAEESLLNSRADLDLALLEHTAAEALFETGRITAAELADSTLSLLEKELALQEARYNYHNAFSRLTPDPPQ